MPVDLDNIRGSAARFEAALHEAHLDMQQRAALAAETDRETHAYQNRTGDLQRSTQASELIEAGDTAAVTLAADMPYASYVAAKGLMNLEELAEQAGADIGATLADVAKRARVL